MEKKTKMVTNGHELIADIREIISRARFLSLSSVNSLHIASNYLIGMRIVVDEQGGNEYAGYGKETMKLLAKELTNEFGEGYSLSNLKNMRKFFLEFSSNGKGQVLSEIFETQKIGQTTSYLSHPNKLPTLQDEMDLMEITRTLSVHFPLSWSHYLFLMRISNMDERELYEKEAVNENWSLRELKRQFDSSLYERLALSKDKAGVKKLSEQGLIIEKHEDVIKDPLVLEFLGLECRHRYTESELELAIIDKMENFLLELGKGFLFEARQKRFTINENHYYVDLVFYNRPLRCYILVDLKIGELKHQDLGQMQMYVNYFDRHVKLDDEQPTVGILLCHSKDDQLVELTLPEDANIHASAYQLYLPDKELLKKQLEEAQAEWELDCELSSKNGNGERTEVNQETQGQEESGDTRKSRKNGR